MHTQTLEQIHEIYKKLLHVNPDTELKVCELGLVIRVYFTLNHNFQSFQTITDIFQQFFHDNHKELKTHFPPGGGSFVKLTDKSFQLYQNKILNNYKNMSRLFWTLCSTPKSEHTANQVPDISLHCEIYTNDENDVSSESPYLSELKFTLPIRYLESSEGLQYIENWINTLCMQLNVVHGYAGFTIQDTYELGSTPHHLHYAFKNYWGITADLDKYEADCWKNSIKSISWYTFINQDLFEQINIDPISNQQFNLEEKIQYWQTNNVHIIKAGLYPSLIQRDQILDHKNYLLINHLLRPLYLKCLPPSSTRYIDQIFMFYWLRRFNLENLYDVLQNNAMPEKEQLPILGSAWTVENNLSVTAYFESDMDGYHRMDDQKYFMCVPYTGSWKPLNFKGFSQHLHTGVKFPECAEYVRESGNISKKDAIWCLDTRDDGQAVKEQNPF